MGSYFRDTFSNSRMLKIQKSIFVLLLLFSVGKVFAQNVESISSELLKDVSANEVYWVVDVVCKGFKEPKSIQQRAGETKWCSSDSSGVCADSKTSLAEMICDVEFESPEIEQEPAATIAVDETQNLNIESSPISTPKIEPEIDSQIEQRQADVVSSVPQVEEAVPSLAVSTPVTATKAPEFQRNDVVDQPNIVVDEPEIIESIPTTPVSSSVGNNSNVSNTKSSIMTAEEIAIEEELILIEQEMLELQLKSIELEQ